MPRDFVVRLIGATWTEEQDHTKTNLVVTSCSGRHEISLRIFWAWSIVPTLLEPLEESETKGAIGTSYPNPSPNRWGRKLFKSVNCGSRKSVGTQYVAEH